MAESVEEFLARGGKIEFVAAGERKYKTINEMARAQKRKKDDEDYTEWRMRRAENQEDIPNG